MNKENDKDICTVCGKACDNLTAIDDETRVCPDCLEENYAKCDECGKYWEIGVVDVEEAPDGRKLCEHCLEALEEATAPRCDRCGKKCDEYDLTEYNDEMLCDECLEQAKIDSLDPSGIWFEAGGWDEVVYQIQGDDACCSASFADWDADEAFELWRTHCVNLEEELDEAFYFYMKKGTLRKGPVYCYFKDSPDSDLAEQLGISEEAEAAMDDGIPPKGWVRVPAKKALPFLNFNYCGM